MDNLVGCVGCLFVIVIGVVISLGFSIASTGIGGTGASLIFSSATLGGLAIGFAIGCTLGVAGGGGAVNGGCLFGVIFAIIFALLANSNILAWINWFGAQ